MLFIGRLTNVTKARVVVESIREGEALGRNTSAYIFGEREIGLLEWAPHTKELGFWQPIVVWDDDPERRETIVRLEHVRIIGIQAGSRFVLGPDL
jgi:hypothetical protein